MVDRRVKEKYKLIVEQLKESEGVTEELKGQEQMEWVQRMGNIQARAGRLRVMS